MTFQDILVKYRAVSFSERDKGDRFERLMQAFLQTVPWYEGKFRHVWLWRELPYKENLGGKIRALILLPRRWKAISEPFSASAMTKNPESTSPLWTVFWLRPASSSSTAADPDVKGQGFGTTRPMMWKPATSRSHSPFAVRGLPAGANLVRR